MRVAMKESTAPTECVWYRRRRGGVGGGGGVSLLVERRDPIRYIRGDDKVPCCAEPLAKAAPTGDETTLESPAPPHLTSWPVAASRANEVVL